MKMKKNIVAAFGIVWGLGALVHAATPWDDVLNKPAPKVYSAPAEVTPTCNVKGVMLESEPFKGRPTRVFAWYGLPEGASATKKCPAMVLIHGGNGTAYDWWVKMWNERGYAAISMDTCGSVPIRRKEAKGDQCWLRHDYSGPEGWGGFDQIDAPLKDQWTYHAVAAAIRAHTFLRSLPEVDAERIGVTGISWGGYLTCIVAGVDPRYKWAVPVYGCGFYGDDSSRWKPQLTKMGARGEKWLATWDASVYLGGATCPFLWVSGTADAFFKVPMLQQSAALTKGPKFFDIRETMVHGHKAGSKPEEIHSFADHFAFGKTLHPNISDHWTVRPKAVNKDKAATRDLEGKNIGAAATVCMVGMSKVDSRYFADVEGKTFVPIGCNICFPRMYDAASPESRAACEERFFGWLRSFAANGGNFTRLWLGHPFFEIMPERAGEYDPAAEATLKKTVALCEELGIRLKLTFESFRTVRPADEEGKGLYSAFFNRPLYAPYAKSMREFLHSEECARIYLGKVRRLKELGLGDSPAVVCWELWNEINSIGGWRNDVAPWSDRMLAALRKMFPRQMTVQNLGSYSGPSAFDYYDYLGRIPLNDFMQIHRYLDPGAELDVCRGPMDVLSADAVRELLDRRPDRPAILAEVGAVKANHTGPSELYVKDKKGMLLHDEIFAPFFAGSAGSGQPWHWDHQYIDGNNLWWHFARFAEAVRNIDPAAEHFRPFRTETRRLRIWGLRGEHTTLLWCRDKANTWENELVRGVPPETISGERIPFKTSFKCYLPWEKRWIDRVEGGILPDFARSIVVHIPTRIAE